MKRNMLIGAAVAVAGAAYLYKRYRNGKGTEEVKDLSRKARHHLTNVFSRAKGNMSNANA